MKLKIYLDFFQKNIKNSKFPIYFFNFFGIINTYFGEISQIYDFIVCVFINNTCIQ